MAKRDFRELDENKVMLIRIKNDHRNQSYALELTPTGPVPENYKIIDRIPRLADPIPPIDEIS